MDTKTTKTQVKAPEFQVVKKVENDLIEDVLITAFEGGSNYWYYLPDLSMVPQLSDLVLSENICKAVFAGAKVPVYDIEDEETLLGTLDNECIQNGLNLMMQKYPGMMIDILGDSWDANHADMLFQLAVMKELVFG